MNAMAIPVQQVDHLKALPRGTGKQTEKAAAVNSPNLVVMGEKQEFRLEIERVGTGDPPSLMLWGEE